MMIEVKTEAKTIQKAIARAIGAELRIAREERGLSRSSFVKRLPSGVGARTLMSYEDATRSLAITRFIEVCHELGVSATELLGRAFQRARIRLEELVLQVDLMAVLADDAPGLVPLHRWAQHKLRRQQSRVAELTPDAMAELADAVGCSKQELTEYLAKFIPDGRTAAECLTEDAVTAVTTRIAQAPTRSHAAVVADAIASAANQGIRLSNLSTAVPDLTSALGKKD